MHSLTSSVRRSRISSALVLALLAAIVGVRLSAQQQPPVSSSNVNMVSGTTFPDGDPYLQRQNEPNAAVSTRNALHLLAGANDYRTVDLPGPFDPMRGFKMAADAWVGLFKSVDGGQDWKSTLLPGFPQDVSPDGARQSPIKGREGATDPVVRSGTNGLFYYAGVAFDARRQPAQRDLRRALHGPEQPRSRRSVRVRGYAAGRQRPGHALPRQGGARHRHSRAPRRRAPSPATSPPTGRAIPRSSIVRTIPAGHVYVAYAAFTGSGTTEQSVIMLSRSTNCGQTLEHADRAEHGVAAGAEPADCRQPGRRRGLRLLAPVQVLTAGPRRDDREIGERRRELQPAAARLRAALVRPGDVGDAVPQQRLPDDGDRRDGPRLPGLDGSRLCDGAQRPAHGRCPHRPLDIGDRDDLDGAESDPGGRAWAIS